MYQTLTQTPIKSGETLEIGVVTTPDAATMEGVTQLLAHKGPEWRAHIEAALRGETDTLETRFYLGFLDGKPVGNIMTVERFGIGIFGHVFTHPEQRRKGICQAIMEQQMEHFQQRGGKTLLLGTGFESPPYWIYHSFGFRSLKGGYMRYSVEEGFAFEERWFAPGETQVTDAKWGHGPLVALIGSLPGREYLRSAAWKFAGIACLEGPLIGFMDALQNRPGVQGVALEKENGAAVGFATLLPSREWNGVWIADAFTHPHFADRTADLLRALKPSDAKWIAYVDTEAPEKAAAYEACGFEREGTLRRFLRLDDTPRDVWLYGKG